MIWPDILFNFAIYGGLGIGFFSLLLLRQQLRKDPAKALLAIILFHLMALLINFALLHTADQSVSPYLPPALILLVFSLAPSLSAYVKAVYRADFSFSRHYYPYLLPALGLLLGYVLPTLFFFNSHPAIAYFHFFFGCIGLLLLWYHVFTTYRKVKHYRQLIRQNFAHLAPHNLHWLTNWIRALIALLALDFLAGFVAIYAPGVQPYFHLVALCYTCFIAYISEQGIRQNRVLLPAFILAGHHFPTNFTGAIKPTEQQSAHSTKQAIPATQPPIPPLFAKDTAENWAHQLEQLMTNQQHYRKDDLKLRELAAALGCTDKQLSYLLNQYLQTNFYEYVNDFRLRAFQKRIAAGDVKRFTILALALDCGFASKSSFNRIFKEKTGLTPTAYVAQQQPANKTTE